MWRLQQIADLEKEMKPHRKRHARAIKNVLRNLATYHAALKAGSNPLQIVRKFIHAEPSGVVAIDQKGEGGKSLKQFRLYVYPDTKSATLFILRFGDKDSQSRDVKDCSKWVFEHLKEQLDNETNEDTEPQKEEPQN